jgi:hypothetical protein
VLLVADALLWPIRCPPLLVNNPRNIIAPMLYCILICKVVYIDITCVKCRGF